MPVRRKSDLPGTLQRSPKKAQRTYAKTLNSALDTYDGNEERAERTAYAALKHTHEKVGDHWEAKDEPGPSDERSKIGGPGKRGRTAGGVDVEGHTKQELYERAKRLEVRGRSKMTKYELARAIARQQD